MEEDKEVSAMAAVNAALAGLDLEATGRVLRWAADRYNVLLPGSGKRISADREEPAVSDSPEERGSEVAYDHFSDFFDAADPTTDSDRVLVSAYWFQVLQNQSELDSQALNKELRNTGHGVTHMPHALDALMDAKPRLMIQLKKKGNTRQARRKFKLTTEGIKRVKSMLRGGD